MSHQFIKENDENKFYPIIFDASMTFDNLFKGTNADYDDGNNNLRENDYYYFKDNWDDFKKEIAQQIF